MTATNMCSNFGGFRCIWRKIDPLIIILLPEYRSVNVHDCLLRNPEKKKKEKKAAKRYR